MKEYVNISPLVLTLLNKRGIDSDEKLSKFLSPSDNSFYDPFLLNDMDRLVARVKQAIGNNEKILIFGDYDVDGVSATAILYKYFESQNYHVDYFLPNRYVDGYGLTQDVLIKIKETFNPKLIISVDCGIACYEEVEFAKSIGIDIIITDHHEVQDKIPNTIVVDPKIPNQKYPCSFLCGTGVAFKVVQALSNLQEAKKYLGIAAIATIADIVPLQDENRAIVQLGMQDFDSNLPLGIKMMLARCGLSVKVSSTDIAFKIAPKINAAGRMGDASVALKLYIKQEKNLLKSIIEQINDFNTQRQELCNKVYDDAIKRLSKISVANYNAIVLFSKEWDSGILGIVAAKIASEFNRPVVLFSEIDGELKGSARSVNAIDIFSAISSMKEVLVAFGGHKMAAGLTIKKQDFTSFLSSLNNYLSKHYTPKDFVPECSYDIEITSDDVTDKFMQDLKLLEPTGCGNPRPMFLTTLDDKASITSMTGHPKHLNIVNKNLTMLAFNSHKYLPLLRSSTDRKVIFELHESEYRNKLYTKGIIQSFVSNAVLPPRAEICQGEYLKQLSCFSAFKGKVLTYNLSQLHSFAMNDEKDLFGTLFVCSNYGSFKSILDITKGMHFSQQIYEIIPNSGINSIILAPSNFENLGSYKKIVFLDAPICKEYISKLCENTPATIYVPSKEKFDNSICSNLKFDRETFGLYYKALSKIAKMCIPFGSDVALFREVYQSNKSLTFKQFIFCLNVFVELGIFEMQDKDGLWVLMENAGVSKGLDNSKFYQRVLSFKDMQKNSSKNS